MNEMVIGNNQLFATWLKRKLSFQRSRPVSRDEFLHLVDPHKKGLYNFIYKALNFSEEADDVYQDSLLRAFRYLHSFVDHTRKQTGSFKSWLFAIAHNEIKKYYNRHKQTPGPWDESTSAAAAEETDNRILDIYEAARKLKPRHREVFFLFYYNQFSLDEIAGITGLKVGNIKFILNRARGKIRQTLEVKQDEDAG